jgi:hypothetical protein
MSRQKSEVSLRSKFTPEEDAQICDLVKIHGDSNWSYIASYLPGRNVRQCRERWRHYLMPSLVNTPFSEEEDATLQDKYKELGPHWKQIASFFVGRTDITLKNRWLFLNRRMLRQKTDSRVPAVGPRGAIIPKPLPIPTIPRLIPKMKDQQEIPWSEEEKFSDEDDDGKLFPEATDLTSDYLMRGFLC